MRSVGVVGCACTWIAGGIVGPGADISQSGMQRLPFVRRPLHHALVSRPAVYLQFHIFPRSVMSVTHRTITCDRPSASAAYEPRDKAWS